MNSGIYKYKIIPYGKNSLGNCEKCHKSSIDYHVIESNLFDNPLDNSLDWTYYNCKSPFVCESCLNKILGE